MEESDFHMYTEVKSNQIKILILANKLCFLIAYMFYLNITIQCFSKTDNK